MWCQRGFSNLKQHVPTFATYEAEVQFEHGIGGGASELIKDGTGVLVVLSRYVEHFEKFELKL